MILTISTLTSFSKKRSKRIGRGHGSGRGTTAGRGTKGQRARSGGRGKGGYGGKRIPPFIFQLPKTRGFRSIRIKPAVVNVGDIEKNFQEGEVVNFTKLKSRGLVSTTASKVKVLGNGTLTKKMTIWAHGFSRKAEKMIVDRGGVARRIASRDNSKTTVG